MASRRPLGRFESYRLKQSGPVLLLGRAVGEKIATGPVRCVRNNADLAAFQAR